MLRDGREHHRIFQVVLHAELPAEAKATLRKVSYFVPRMMVHHMCSDN